MLNVKQNRKLGQELAARKETIQYYYRVAALWYETKSQAIKLLDWKQLWTEAKESGDLEQFLLAPGYRNNDQDPYSDNDIERRGYTPREYDMDAYYEWQVQRLTEEFALGVGDITMCDKTNPNEKQLQNIHRKLRQYMVEQLDILLVAPEHQQMLFELNCQVEPEKLDELIELREENAIKPLNQSDRQYLQELEIEIGHALTELLVALNKKRMDDYKENNQPDADRVPLSYAETERGR